MDNELTQPLGELSPLYSLGTEFTKQRGGTGHVVTDEDTNALRLATKIMQNQDQELAPNRITAYHGSPHEFDEFDTAKIGTGEGAQAYGHGLYFAESEPVAKRYRDKLSNYISDEMLQTYFKPESIVPSYGGMDKILNYDPEKRLVTAQGIDPQGNLSGPIRRHGTMPDLKKLNEEFKRRGLDPYVPGHMYEVAIDAHPDHMLDWDKPLSEQSEHVQNALIKIGQKDETQYGYGGGSHYYLTDPDSHSGSDFYRYLAGQNEPTEASNILHSHGIKGIKYLDAGSRGQGEGTSNYAVFDPKDIEIMRRYARGGDVRHGYSVDGMVKPDNNTIEMPHSLKELMDWSKNHPAPKPMVRASDDPTSILYDERKIDMPNSLQELQNWNRTHRALGGDIDDIEHALRLSKTTTKKKNRKHYEDGGSDGDHQNEMHENETHESDSSDSRDAVEKDFSNDRSDDVAKSILDGQMNRGLPEGTATADVSRFGFGQGFNTGDAAGLGVTDVKAPQDIREYTQQRLDHPYEGTVMSATQDPSTAFGMSYPELVGKQLSPEGARAFLGNLGYESTYKGEAFNPQAVSGSGYGLAQWTGPRAKEFFAAMNPEGPAPVTKADKIAALSNTTAQQQLGYALKEALGGGYGPTAAALTTPGSVADKINTITRNYEGAGIPATEKRLALANLIGKDQGLGQFASSGFDSNAAQPTAYASNVPTPIARPADLNDQMAKADIVKAIIGGAKQGRDPRYSFTGSTEDPDVIRQQRLAMNLPPYAHGGSVADDDIHHALHIAQSMGRGNDSILAHINPKEAALLKAHGGSGKTNPHTGLMEFDDSESGGDSGSGDSGGGIGGFLEKIFGPTPTNEAQRLSYLPINPSNPGLGNSTSDTGGVSDYSGKKADDLKTVLGFNEQKGPFDRSGHDAASTAADAAASTAAGASADTTPKYDIKPNLAVYKPPSDTGTAAGSASTYYDPLGATTFTPATYPGSTTSPVVGKAYVDPTLNNIYQTNFGRAYDPINDQYWGNQLSLGNESFGNKAKLIQDIIGGAQGADLNYYNTNVLKQPAPTPVARGGVPRQHQGHNDAVANALRLLLGN